MLKVEQKEFWSDTSFRGSTAVLSPPEQPTSFPNEPDMPLVEPPSALRERARILSRIEEDPGPDLFEGVYLTGPAEKNLSPPSQDDAAEDPPEPAGYWRHRASRTNAPYAEQSSPGPRFNMARFLSLSGSLDSGDRDDRWFVLPRRRYRPHPELGIKTSDVPDTLKDLHLSSRNFSLASFFRRFGRLIS
jgi:hypothetical protein